jgi:hypothetical protein
MVKVYLAIGFWLLILDLLSILVFVFKVSRLHIESLLACSMKTREITPFSKKSKANQALDCDAPKSARQRRVSLEVRMMKMASILVATVILLLFLIGGLSQLTPFYLMIIAGVVSVVNAQFAYRERNKTKKLLPFLYSTSVTVFAIFVIATTAYSRILLDKFMKDTASSIQSSCCDKGICSDTLTGWEKVNQNTSYKTFSAILYKYKLQYVIQNKHDEFSLGVKYALDNYGSSISGGIAQCKGK